MKQRCDTETAPVVPEMQSRSRGSRWRGANEVPTRCQLVPTRCQRGAIDVPMFDTSS